MLECLNESLALDLQNQGAFCRLKFKKGLKIPFKVDHSPNLGYIQVPKDLKPPMVEYNWFLHLVDGPFIYKTKELFGDPISRKKISLFEKKVS